MNPHHPRKKAKKASPASHLPASASLKALKNENQKLRRQLFAFQQQQQQMQMQGFLESEEKYRVLTEKSPNMIFISQGGRVVYANPKCEEVMGYKRKEFYASKFNFLSLMHPEEFSKIRHNFLMHQRGKEVAPYEYKMITKGGEVIHGILTSKLIRYRGAPAILGIVTDITRRKLAEEAVKKALSLEQATLESTADGILVVDNKTRKATSFNDQFARLWRIPKKVLSSRDDKELLKYVLPQLRYPQKFLSKVMELYRHPRRDSFDTLEFKDGRSFERYSHPQLVDGKPVGRVWSFRDVTERKQAEEALNRESSFRSSIIENQPGMVWLKDKKSRFLAVNQKFADACGYKDPRELAGKTDLDIWPRVLAQKYRADDHKVMTTLKPLITQELIEEKGILRWYETFKTPVRDLSGKILGTSGFAQDITERKRAEEALRESERRFRSIFASSRDAMMTLEPPSWRFTSSNSAMARMFKAKNATEFTSYEPWVLSPKRQPDGRTSVEKAKDMINAAMRKGSHFFEWTHKRINGEEFPAEVLLTRVEEEEKIFLQATVRDITERKRAEEEVRQENGFRNAIIDRAAEGLCVCHEITRFPYIRFTVWNGRMTEITGYTMKEINQRGWYQSVYPDPEYRAQAIKRMERMRKGDDILGEEWTITRKNGKTRTLLISTSLVDGPGGQKNVLGLMHDITERKRSEDSLQEHRRQLLQIIDTVPHMIFAKGNGNRFLLANRATAEAYQKEPKDLIGMRRQDVHKNHQEMTAFLKGDREVLRSGKPRIFSGESFTDAHGRKRILQTIKIPFKMIGVKETCVLGVSVDVTEQKKIEDFRNDIVRTVSHELRTPLSIEKEGISLLMDGVVGTVNMEQKGILETVMRSIDRLSRMITNLLDVSNIETGKIKLLQKMTNLGDLVKEVAFEFKKRAGEKGVDLNVKLPGRAVCVLVDPDKITQVLSNLVDNAIKFTPERGAVEVALDVLKNEVECTVWDNGIGIAPKNVTRVFEKFEQFSRADGPGEKGFGLGLSIARGIIELHGGRIWIKSELGKGTRVTFSLPLYQKKEG